MRPLPIGVVDFKEIISLNYHYIDKSLFIKELLTQAAKVTLIPRPRRFGKTLNLSMLRYFFENTAESHAYLFEHLAIAQHPECMAHQGQYPVIFLTFKFCDDANWDECFEGIKRVIANEFRRHSYILEKNLLDVYQQQEFKAIIALTASIGAYKVSLKNLIEYLARYHNQNPIVLLDEYDVPMHAGYYHKYYNKTARFIRKFLGDGLKDNTYLRFAVITGAMRITKESIFTGLNHPSVCTMLDPIYADKFGLVEEEVDAFMKERGLSYELDAIRAWYNGYSSGTCTVYNPWSILNCARNNGELGAYWINTGNTDILKDLIGKSDYKIKEDIALLLQGKSICKMINENISFLDLKQDEVSIFNFLLFSGYLTFKNKQLRNNIPHADFCIPNKEIELIYKTTILSWFKNVSTYTNMLDTLVSGDITLFAQQLEEYCLTSLSYFDATKREPERFYHALILGMLAHLSDVYAITSNRESGTGRYDVMMEPHDNTKPAFIIEFKKVRAQERTTLKRAAEHALQQIEEKEYAVALRKKGYKHIIPLAIAFSGKKVYVMSHFSQENDS